MFTEEERAKFKQRFAKWKAGEKPYKNGRISDEEYVRIMEKVAADNWLKWGEDNEDSALTRILNDNVYDYRGYYSKYPNSAANADTHWNDEFKTVWHPTFSLESKYSGKKSQFNPYGYPGGTWQGELFNPLWYLQHQGYGFYKDGYPKLPRFAMGTEGDVDMGPKNKTYNKEAVKQILHELPLSPIDPVMSVYLGLTAIGKLFSLGRFYIKNRLSKEAQQDYKQFRRNGYSPAVSRNFVTDTYVNDISKVADKLSRVLDFGL